MLLAKLRYGAIHRLGVTRLFRWWYRGRVVVLGYHGVSGDREMVAADPHRLTVHADDLDKQFRFLKAHYNVVSLSEFVGARSSGTSLPPYSVVLTFDDGLRNFYSIVLPLLKKYALPAALFVITDRLDEASNPAEVRPTEWTPGDDHTYMSWDELRSALTTGLVECGSHTCSHPDLTDLPASAATFELSYSRDRIRAMTGVREMAFVYPHGRSSKALAALVEASGYTCGFGVEEGNIIDHSNPLLFRRPIVRPEDDLSKFAARLANLTSFAPAALAVFRRVLRLKQPPLRDPSPLRPSLALPRRLDRT